MPEYAAAASLRVLLAEDNPVVKTYTALLLGKLGYRADVAGNGIEVVEAIGRQSYDVVLMDVQMPELDGLDATRQIRSLTRSATVPWVIAMTANASAADCEACVAAGMNDFLAKPAGLQELQDALKRADRALGKENQVPVPFVQLGTQPSQDLSEGRRINSQLLFRKYMEDACQTVDQLISLAEVNDFANLQRKAHYLKGSSLVVGAVEAGRICSQIERRAAAQQSVLLLLEELRNSLALKSIAILGIPERVG